MNLALGTAAGVRKKRQGAIDYEALSKHGYKGGPSILKVPDQKVEDKEQDWSWSTGRNGRTGRQSDEDKSTLEESFEERERTRTAASQGENLLNVTSNLQANQREKKNQSFSQKEKRKRDLGQASRGKNYVEEEKRLLRGSGTSIHLQVLHQTAAAFQQESNGDSGLISGPISILFCNNTLALLSSLLSCCYFFLQQSVLLLNPIPRYFSSNIRMVEYLGRMKILKSAKPLFLLISAAGLLISIHDNSLIHFLQHVVLRQQLLLHGNPPFEQQQHDNSLILQWRSGNVVA
ncbi:hypothetical protein J5N97_009922 [Dioscorea zingiberensis]|uniref:Uncharacterized protein n=1 Tax=Dioscorea zingiberensis TaxID=325984 RepID=A0A9D5CZ76_9LILI|nr:hypothetical protein J5N97_009922 [Dioscorea zingiberensis]